MRLGANRMRFYGTNVDASVKFLTRSHRTCVAANWRFYGNKGVQSSLYGTEADRMRSRGIGGKQNEILWD